MGSKMTVSENMTQIDELSIGIRVVLLIPDNICERKEEGLTTWIS
jgi:hypothetical protein